jgi:hypothetical protein
MDRAHGDDRHVTPAPADVGASTNAASNDPERRNVTNAPAADLVGAWRILVRRTTAFDLHKH